MFRNSSDPQVIQVVQHRQQRLNLMPVDLRVNWTCPPTALCSAETAIRYMNQTLNVSQIKTYKFISQQCDVSEIACHMPGTFLYDLYGWLLPLGFVWCNWACVMGIVICSIFFQFFCINWWQNTKKIKNSCHLGPGVALMIIFRACYNYL